MKRTEWFDRHFPVIEDSGLLPGIIERLEGTPTRLRNKIGRVSASLTAHEAGKWSIKKEIGHLIDLEPLWLERALQITRGEADLIKADLTNRKTHETDHDSQNINDLIGRFENDREKLVSLLRNADDNDLVKAAVHPRLGTPMKLVDLAYFVAEHDDHHLAQITLLSRQGIK